MKTKMFAAIAFAAFVTFMSCKWFSSHKKYDGDNTGLVAGRYEVMSVTDSSTDHKLVPGDTLRWFFNLPLKDSSKRYLSFKRDSVIIYEAPNTLDSTRYYADTANKIIYLKHDSTYQPFRIILSDSMINLVAANDSVYIALKKL